MSTQRSHYNEYWSRETPPPLADPLTPGREAILWNVLSSAGATRLLDCGAGIGATAQAAVLRGFEVVAMDVSETALALGAEHHPDVRFVRQAADEGPWPFSDESFDVVYSFEVIEHLLHPRTLLTEARRVLGPGGRLVISTPYHGTLKNLALALACFDEHFDVNGDHIRFFSDRALRASIAEAGFGSVQINHLGRTWPVWANSIAIAIAG